MQKLLRLWENGRLRLRIRRENILVDSMEQLLGIQKEHLHHPFRIEFIGEAGIDAGGLQREWFTRLFEQILDESLGLFVVCYRDQNTLMLNPNSKECTEDHLLYFQGIGRLIGRALLEGHTLQARLCLPILKHLVGDKEPIVIDLKPNGRDIEVTDTNKKEYLELKLRYLMLDRYALQLQALSKGLFEVIPQENLMVFDYQELELVLCGLPEIDVKDWKRYTCVPKSFVNSPVVNWFWQVIESMEQEDRARFLQFCTGSARVPVQGFQALTSYDGRISHFSLRPSPNQTRGFPRVHTCFNRVELPLYNTKKELEEALYTLLDMEVTEFSDE